MWSFTFKGESSRDYGITVNRRAPRQSANTRTVLTEIDGRDGAVIEKVGYNTYTMNMQITVQGKDNLHRISSWLKGEGKFTRSDIEGRYLLVKHESEIEFTMISNNLYTSQITFQVMYPKWLKEDSWSRPWGANLIPNGWDSFEPYGSGDNLLPSTNVYSYMYSEAGSGANLTFKHGVHFAEAKTNNAINIISKDSKTTKQVRIRHRLPDVKDEFTERITIKNNGNSPVRLWTGLLGNNVIKSRETLNIENTQENPYEDMFNGYIESVDKVSDIDVTFFRHEIFRPDDSPLTVEKTPLENGLTRIQTWGGTTRNKIRYMYYASRGVTRTYSSVVDNNSSDTVEFRLWDGKLTMVRVNPYEKKIVGITSKSTLADCNITIGYAENKNQITDFIASTPTIVEGDTPPTWEADENPRIVNEGNTSAQPIIKIIKNKEEKLDVVINGTRLIYEFDNSKYIDIDCYTQEVTDDQGLSKARNLKIGYEFPELKPGDNVVQVLSGDATILFRRKDAWK